MSIPFSFANFLASGDIKILSADSFDTKADFTSSLTSGFGSSLTSGFGSSLTSGFGSSFIVLLPLIIDEISSPFAPITAIILSTGAVEPSSIPI